MAPDGAVWMGGAAPEVDAAGNIWAATGNGSSDTPYDGSDSVIELSSQLALQAALRPERLVRRQRRTTATSGRPRRRCSPTGRSCRPASRRRAFLLSQGVAGGHRRADRRSPSDVRRSQCRRRKTPWSERPCTCHASGGSRPSRPAPRSACSGRRATPGWLPSSWRVGAPDRGRRSRVVDRGEHALRARPHIRRRRPERSLSAVRPTTSRHRRSVTACSWRPRPIRSCAFSGSAGLPGPPSPPPPAPPELLVLDGRLRRGHLQLSAMRASTARPAACR